MAGAAAKEIVCPLTNQVFVDPVIASDGYTYERAAIANHVSREQLSPFDGSALEDRFYPNVMIRQDWGFLQEFKEVGAAVLALVVPVLQLTVPR
jgi:hypothetical protein